MKPQNRKRALLVWLFLSCLPLYSQSVEMHGFLLGTYTGRNTGQRPNSEHPSDFLLAEERFQLEASAAIEDSIEASARVKVDLFHDAVSNTFDIDLRQAHLDYATGNFDFRLGRQILTWGTGDLLFINDAFAKDWASFFSGKPLQYLKVGSDGLSFRYWSNLFNAEAAILFFQPDLLPSPSHFFLFDPYPTVTARKEELPAKRYGDLETSLRLFRNIRGWDLALYLSRGFWKQPSIIVDDPDNPANLTFIYPRMTIYGFSAQGAIASGLGSVEIGYYDTHQLPKNSTVPSDRFKFLLGYQTQLSADLNMGIQYLSEIQKKSSSSLHLAARKRYRDTLTLRWDRFLQHQTKKVSLFLFYSFTDQDLLFQPETVSHLSDNLTLTFGANIFEGKDETTLFGQHDRNDNLYASFQIDF